MFALPTHASCPMDDARSLIMPATVVQADLLDEGLAGVEFFQHCVSGLGGLGTGVCILELFTALLHALMARAARSTAFSNGL